jgi:hypothetical protein
LHCRKLGRDKEKKKIEIDKYNSKSFKNQKELFAYKWKNSPTRKCFVTEQNLKSYESTDMFVNCFAHVVSKKSAPEFKLYENNLVLLDPEVHRIYDFGTLEQILAFEKKNACSFKILFEFYLNLVSEYNKEFSKKLMNRKMIDEYLKICNI